MKNKTLVHSIVSHQCPGCRSEKMFVGQAYSKKFSSMHKHCPNCGQALEPEPGFYTGAMYISYAFQVIILVVATATYEILHINGSIIAYLMLVAGINLLLFPLLFRLSRSVWAHLFIPFKPQTWSKVKEL